MITKKQIEHIIKRYRIKLDSYTYGDGVIDVRGSVTLTDTSLRRLPIKFGRVDGDFHCHTNKLETLKGSPNFVGGSFNCASNQLTSLKSAPCYVGADFACHENLLTSLKGSPQHIYGNFNAFLNELTSLEGAPVRIDKNCSLFQNQLTSLKSGPSYVGGSFHITGNRLTDLIGIPEYIGNVLSMDNTALLYTARKNCVVKTVKIEVQHKMSGHVRILPSIICEKHVPFVMKYLKYLDVFSADGSFDQSLWEDVIFDIESGLK